MPGILRHDNVVHNIRKYSLWWASAVWRQCDIERNTFLIKALISRDAEQDVMNKLWKIYETKTVRKWYANLDMSILV